MSLSDQELHQLVQRYQAEQREAEVIWFYRAVEGLEPTPQVIVEIGIKEGGNLKVLSTHLDKNGKAIGIDPRQEIPWNMKDSDCHVYHIARSSHEQETKDRLIEILDGQEIDVLFIDGDHSTEGMLQDYEDYSPLVRKGGIIAVHDIYYLEEVKVAWSKVKINKRGKVFESPWNQSSIGIGYIVKE